MLKKLALILAITASGASFATDPWTDTDKAEFVGLTAINAVDMVQTLRIARNPDRYYERNGFLGEQPSQGRVVAYFLGAELAEGLITTVLPQRWRKYFLTGAIAVSAGFVAHNYSIGLKVAL